MRGGVVGLVLVAFLASGCLGGPMTNQAAVVVGAIAGCSANGGGGSRGMSDPIGNARVEAKTDSWMLVCTIVDQKTVEVRWSKGWLVSAGAALTSWTAEVADHHNGTRTTNITGAAGSTRAIGSSHDGVAHVTAQNPTVFDDGWVRIVLRRPALHALDREVEADADWDMRVKVSFDEDGRPVAAPTRFAAR